MNAIEANARIRIERDVNLTLKNLKLRNLGQLDEVLLTPDRRYKHYKQMKIAWSTMAWCCRSIIENWELQILPSSHIEQLVDEVLWNLYGYVRRYPGITKIIIANREKYSNPKMAELLKKWAMSCKQCIKESQIDGRLIGSPQNNLSDHRTGTEAVMQIDLVPALPPSCGCENTVTALDEFSRFLIAHPKSGQTAETITKVILIIVTRLASSSTTFISHNGSTFVSHVIKKTAVVLGNTLHQFSAKHAQTIGQLEQSHASSNMH